MIALSEAILQEAKKRRFGKYSVVYGFNLLQTSVSTGVINVPYDSQKNVRIYYRILGQFGTGIINQKYIECFIRSRENTTRHPFFVIDNGANTDVDIYSFHLGPYTIQLTQDPPFIDSKIMLFYADIVPEGPLINT